MIPVNSVKLISVTPDAEKTILFCARVSSDQENMDSKLLGYLLRNRHWSPFEMAHMVLEITTSRAIAAQILRHRSFSFQEFSQRYTSPESAFMFEARGVGTSNRQSSVDNLDKEVKDWWLDQQDFLFTQSFDLYEAALEKGIAREVARAVLPLSTATKLYMAGSVRSWIHYFDLRCDEHTQLEHREIALEARTIFNEQFPIIAEALNGQ